MSIEKFDLIIFDWDGTLVSSHDAYREMDSLFVQNYYGATMSKNFFWELSDWMKRKKPSGHMDAYYSLIDTIFGDGTLQYQDINKKIKETKEDWFLSKVSYKPDSYTALKMLRFSCPNIALALVTGTEKFIIDYFSSQKSKLSHYLSPNKFFDLIITKEDVDREKPDPQPYEKTLEYFCIKNPHKVLVIEDSLLGILSAKATGTKVGVIYDKYSDSDREIINEAADYVFCDWNDFIEKMLKV